MIWDLHGHLAGFRGQTPHQKMAELMRYADRMNIERVVIFMGYPFDADPAADELKRENDQVLSALEHWHDRAFGFAYVNPRHVEASLAEMQRCIAEGPMVGIKLWIAVRCHDERLDPIIRRADELKAVVYQHTWIKSGGNFAGESTPADLAVLAARHPHTPLICGHTGGNWELGIRAIRSSANVSIGIGGSDPTSGFVEMAVRELGPQRVIYGSDVAGRSHASQLAKVQGADIPADAKRQILGENLKQLIHRHQAHR